MKLTIKSYLNIGSIIPNVLIPLLVLAAYSGSFAVLSSRYLVEGINFYFSFFQFYLLLLIIGLVLSVSVICLLINILKKGKKIKINNPKEQLNASDIFLLILPLTPVFQYLINNQDILSIIDIIIVVIFFVIFSSIFIFVIPLLLQNYASSWTTMALGLAFTFTITNMASLSRNFNWYASGDFVIQVLFFGFTFLFTWLLYNLRIKNVLFILITMNLVVNSFIAFQYSDGFTSDAGDPLPINLNKDNGLLSIVDERKPDVVPNIYFLVYESYVPNETMLAYGFDNSNQEDYLLGQGFTLYPHTYSVGSPSIESLSRVFNASTQYYGNRRRAVSGDGVVHNLLKFLDYKTYGLFPYDHFLIGVGSNYDFAFTGHSDQNMDSKELMILAILLGEFRFDLGFGSSRDYFIETKQSVFNHLPESPIFIYMHSDFPGHSQFTGSCRPNETDLFKDNVPIANLEMKQDIEIIIANDPESIIIVAGDHGPYLTKNCFHTARAYDIEEINRLDIQDRFATFLAIRWPTENYEEFDDITVLQDLFPAIFAYMYQDVTILETKIDPVILCTDRISGATVKNGIIIGGINDGEPLFISDN